MVTAHRSNASYLSAQVRCRISGGYRYIDTVETMTTLIDEVHHRRRLPAPSVARLIREAADVSQARLAREIGVDRVTVSRWEAGTRHPRGDTLVAYSDVLVLLRDAITATSETPSLE